MLLLITLFLWVCTALSFEDCPNVSGAFPKTIGSDLLIDTGYIHESLSLDLLRIYDLGDPNACCVNGIGERKLLRFGLKITNHGENAFELGAPPPEIAPCTSEGIIGNWTWSLCSHKPVWKWISVYSVDLLDMEGTIIVHGGHRNLCIRDDSCEDGKRVYDCAFQGITPGCSSEYPASRHCQWIDITGVPDSTYLLEITLNPTGELGYQSNNKVRLLIQLEDIPSYVPRNTHRAVGLVIGCITIAVVLIMLLLP